MNTSAVQSVWYPVTVFYNGSNSAVARDVRPLMQLEHHGRLVFVDSSSPEFDEDVLAGTPLRREDLLKWVYARDAHGRWRIGIGALQTAYRAAY